VTPEPGTAGALASEVCAWLDRLFPDADRGERLKRALGERFGDDGRAVTAELCREVEAVAHGFSRHLAPRSRCCAAPGARCWTCGATAAEIREP